MIITSTTKLDLHSAVNYGLDMSRHYSNFFIDTEFGTVPVEMDYRNGDGLVTVDDWKTCPLTKFVTMNRGNDYDYILRINYVRGQHHQLTQLELVWGLSNILLQKLNPGISGRQLKNYANILTVAYIETYYMPQDARLYAKAYVEAHNKMARFNAKNFRMVVDMATKNLETIYNEAKKGLKEFNSRIDREDSEIHRYDFENMFYDVVATMTFKSTKYKRSKYTEIVSIPKAVYPVKVSVIDLLMHLAEKEHQSK